LADTGPAEPLPRRRTVMSLKQSIYIEAPVEKVFDFCKDPRKTWAVGPDRMGQMGELLDVKMTEDGVGTYYSWAFNLSGLRVEGFNVFTEFVPNQRITDRSSRAVVGTWTFTVEPEASGTRLTMWREPVSFWALRPVDQLMDRFFRASLGQQTLEKLKAVLEGTTESATPSASGGGAQ
jgi:Polyketide cyclase / dehydrase and lipid transport